MLSCKLSYKACNLFIQHTKKNKRVCAIFFAKKTLIFHNLRCLCHLLVMDSRWVTKQMAQTHVKRKALPKNPPRARGFVSMKTKMFFISFSYIACFCSYEAWKKKRSRKVSVQPLLRKATVKFHILRCLCHLSSRHGNKSRRHQFWILF